MIQELKKIGLEEVKGRVVDTGFAPQVSKEWIDRLLQRPVKSFKDAIAGIDASFVSGQDRAVREANSKPVDTRKGLEVDEISAIHLYTQKCLHEELNNALRSNDEKKREPFLDFTRLLLSALQKLPNEPKGVVYRVVDDELSDGYGKGKSFFWSAFSSCATEGGAAMKFANKNRKPYTVFSISGHGKRIAEFSAYEGETEVLLPISTEFRVAGQIPIGKMTMVHLTIVEPETKKRKRTEKAKGGRNGEKETGKM